MIFRSLTSRFQLRFKDRVWAASVLAEGLKEIINKEKLRKEDITVLGIPRGGVVTADRVAQKLSVPYNNFDIVISKKIGAPHNKELGIGAVMEDGSLYLDNNLIRKYEVADLYIQRERSRQLEEVKRRLYLYKGSDRMSYDAHGKVLVLVDDGAATGATLTLAARWLRKNHHPRKLIIGVPVAPKPVAELLQNECDNLEVITKPAEYFSSVGQYYKDFSQVTDQEVIKIMQQRHMVQ